MSIATNSVLRRILEEVRVGPTPTELGSVESFGGGKGSDQHLQIRRTSDVHRPPFSTPLHYWSHALRGFLVDRGRIDVFDALANHCLCEAVAPEEVGAALDALGERVQPGLAISGSRDLDSGYRMIDQDGLVSWVAERSGEFVAVFWVRSSWLLAAEPLVLV